MSTEPLLPELPIYGLINGIPETFGGRTGVCLRRANTFAELGQKTIEILTLTPNHPTEPEELTDRLRREGRIGKRVRIRNVWTDLRRASDEQLRELASTAHTNISVDSTALLEPTEGLQAQRSSSTGRILQTDRFRNDLTRFSSHRADMRKTEAPRGRAIALFGRDGAFIGAWPEQHQLFTAWIDWVVGSRMTILINDGPKLASYLYRYRRSNVLLVQTIHSRHSSMPQDSAGTNSVTYLPSLKHMDCFDRVAVLTQAQHDDLKAMGIAKDNLVVLPNMVETPSTDTQVIASEQHRDRSAGIVLARFSKQKRIDQAVKAVERARDLGSAARLDLYGVSDNAEHDLHALIKKLGVGDHVMIRGYDPNARKKFGQASFSVLTSKYEGQSLVVLESMAAGCIPISYDISYGPSDIITHGVDGFLVPNQDIDALARTIHHVTSMSHDELSAMREAAIRRSQDFSPTAITRAWGEVLQDALHKKTTPKDVTGKAKLMSAKPSDAAVDLKVKVSGPASAQPRWAMLTWVQKDGLAYGRVPATIRSNDPLIPGVTIEATLAVERLKAARGGTVEFNVDLRVGNEPVRLRVQRARRANSLEVDGLQLHGSDRGDLNGHVS